MQDGMNGNTAPALGSIITDEHREAVNKLRMGLIFVTALMNECGGLGLVVNFNINRGPDGRFALVDVSALRQERVVLPPLEIPESRPEGAGAAAN